MKIFSCNLPAVRERSSKNECSIQKRIARIFLFADRLRLYRHLYAYAGSNISRNKHFRIFSGLCRRPVGSSFFGFLVPLLTMRSFAEERRTKTDQLLLTSPVRIISVVMGKFFAAVTVLAITLLLSFIYPVILAILGSPSWGEIISAYVGFLLMGCASIAIGVMISAATQSQVVAAVVTFGVFFMLLMTSNVIKLISSEFLRQTLTALSLFDRMRDFTSGVLGLSPIIYYISICAVCIFVTVRIIEKRRWSGN